MTKSGIEAIACGIFKREIGVLIRSGRLSLPCTFLDSMLHMMPALLACRLEETLAGKDRRKVVLVYGDCHPRMFEFRSGGDICRTVGMNCCEIILGREKYRELRDNGAFFLLPEWTERWAEVFQQSLGFNADTAKVFMGEMHTRLIYLDTGIIPVPHKALQTAAEFCGLPVEIMGVTLDHLLKTIVEAVARLSPCRL